MGNGIINESYLNDIAIAIQSKTGSSSTMTPSEMAGRIDSIPIAGDVDLGPGSFSANGTYSAASDNLDGYDTVTVSVPLSSITISANGSYSAAQGGYNNISVEVPQVSLSTLNVSINDTYTAPSGTAYNEVSVNVQPNLENITVSSNGVYTATSGYDGLGEVNVNVSSGSGGTDYVQDGLEIQSKSIGRGVTSPLLTDPAQYKTIECCFKWNSVDSSSNQGRAVTLENSDGEIFAININQAYTNNVEWKVGTWTDDGESGIAMAVNSYHTFSFVFFEENNTEKVSVYYDGVKVTTQNGSLGAYNIIRICFKQSYTFAGRDLDGNVKNFRVYSRALTDNEISLNYAVDQSRYGA